MIKDVIRLKWHAQLSHAQIATTLKISKGVVAKYVGLATAAGLDWDAVQDWSEQQLWTALQPRSAGSLPVVVPDWGRIHRELDRKGVTLMLLWQEYVDAQLKYPSATLEDASFEGIRGIDRSALMSLALSTWIERGETICFAGATGLGKTWLACALAQYACRQGHSALYLRVPRLAEELRILHGAGSFRRWLQQLAKIDVLVLDDWGTGAIDAATRADLLEIIDDRSAQRATIITHQLPIEHWHAWLGDPTLADAILDRLMQHCRRFSLDGESRRTGRVRRALSKPNKTDQEDPS